MNSSRTHSDPTEAVFLKDVAAHEMIVFRDDGVHRHVRFRRPGTMCMHFDLITWPGHLCYTGDMGTYVFSRLDDMFEFFRSDSGRINPSYWGEKLQAVDCSGVSKGCATKFSRERFERVIIEYRLAWIREARATGRLTKSERRELWGAVQDEVLEYLEGDEHADYQRADDFSWRAPNGQSYSFTDLWDHQFTDYTFHFIWCCYALAWGIKRYDESMAVAGVAA